MAFWRTFYHLVWATKNRHDLIDPAFEPQLFDYLLRKAQGMGVHIFAINGMPDHIHLIVSIPPKYAVAEVVKNLKGASAHDFSRMGYMLSWQPGYGVLTLGERQKAVAEEYVCNQKMHHAEKTTNPWLEHISAEDTQTAPELAPRQMREDQELYWIDEGLHSNRQCT